MHQFWLVQPPEFSPSMKNEQSTQHTTWIIVHFYIYIYLYIILCLLDKQDKCNVSKLAVTIKIQYLCVLKVHKIITGKKKKPKKNQHITKKNNNLSSSQRYKYTVQIYFCLKTVQIKMQQNRDINALLKSGRCRVF